MAEPKAIYEFAPNGVEPALEFLKRTRNELRELRMVRVFKDHWHIIDINGDYFEMRGIGYADVDIVPLLRNLKTAFNPQTIHSPISGEYKEFKTGNRRCWAEDRVM
jgi:hypothetical protein